MVNIEIFIDKGVGFGVVYLVINTVYYSRKLVGELFKDIVKSVGIIGL